MINFEIKPSTVNIKVNCLREGCRETDIVSRLGPKFPFFNRFLEHYACRHCKHEDIKVVPPDPLLSHEERENLRVLLKEASRELTRYRDYEWKILIWQLTLAWGWLYIFNLLRASFFKELIVYVDISACIVLLFATFLLSEYLLFAHEQLTANGNRKRQIERLLGFYSSQISLLPSKWAHELVPFKRGLDLFIIPFFLVMWISCLIIIYTIAYKYPVCNFIKELGNVFVTIWQFFIPAIIVVLLLILMVLTLKNVCRQRKW